MRWKASVNCYLGIGVLSAMPMVAYAAIHSADSNTTIVDTRNNLLAVSGRVLDATSRLPVNGANATLAGQSTSSSASGQFAWANVSLNAGNTFAVSKAGYASYSGIATIPAAILSPAQVLPRQISNRRLPGDSRLAETVEDSRRFLSV